MTDDTTRISPHDVNFRALEDGDRPAVTSLISRCYEQYPGCIFDHGELPELRAIGSHFRDLGGTGWAADWRGRLVGCVGVHPAARGAAWQLSKLYVDPTARRLGLGRRLVGLALDFARRQGGAVLELWTDTRFAEAHQLYESMGFTRGPRTRAIEDLSQTVEYYYRQALG